MCLCEHKNDSSNHGSDAVKGDYCYLSVDAGMSACFLGWVRVATLWHLRDLAFDADYAVAHVEYRRAVGDEKQSGVLEVVLEVGDDARFGSLVER